MRGDALDGLAGHEHGEDLPLPAREPLEAGPLQAVRALVGVPLGDQADAVRLGQDGAVLGGRLDLAEELAEAGGLADPAHRAELEEGPDPPAVLGAGQHDDLAAPGGQRRDEVAAVAKGRGPRSSTNSLPLPSSRPPPRPALLEHASIAVPSR